MNVFTLFGLSLWVIGAIGWVWNIVKLFSFYETHVLVQTGGIEVLRIIGIFLAPMGSILGFF